MAREGDDLTIRPAEIDDAEAVAQAHVATWQAAYEGLMPADFLAALDWRERLESTRTWLGSPRPDVATLVAVRGHVLGFSTFGPVRDEDLIPDNYGEIYAIYVLPEAWSTGAGSGLLKASLRAMSAYDVVALWVLEANVRARRFYQRHGFAPDASAKTIEIGSATLPELRYVRPN